MCAEPLAEGPRVESCWWGPEGASTNLRGLTEEQKEKKRLTDPMMAAGSLHP